MNSLFVFADHRPTTFIIALIIVGLVAASLFRVCLLAYNRRLRSLNIRAKGWPAPPLDADGDVVYRKHEGS